MTQEFHATIASKLDPEQIAAGPVFPFKAIVDTRCSASGKASAIEESLLRQLKSFQIGYDQEPINFRAPTRAQENRIVCAVMEKRDRVLVLTDQISDVMDLFQDVMIPASSAELRSVPTSGPGGKHMTTPPFMDWQIDEAPQRMANA